MKKIKVLDHGFVRLVDSMGSDQAIVDAARVSLGDESGKKSSSSTRNLIRYLMRHQHTTPFEMCELKFHVKLPIFVARQWMRHRTWSYNEVSGRYSVLPGETYDPQRVNPHKWRGQSGSDKQGSDGYVNYNSKNRYIMHEDDDKTYSDETVKLTYIEEVFKCTSDQAAKNEYRRRTTAGVAREQARICLPLATYTEFYAKVNLGNLMHFLKLRMDSHAQREIRVYAEALFELSAPLFPEAMTAFSDYVLEAVTLTRLEIEAIREGRPLSLACSDREHKEFDAKRSRLGLDRFHSGKKLNQQQLIDIGVRWVEIHGVRYPINEVDYVVDNFVALKGQENYHAQAEHLVGAFRMLTHEGTEITR